MTIVLVLLIRLAAVVLVVALSSVAVAVPPSTQFHLLYRGINPAPLPATALDQHGAQAKIQGLSGITFAGDGKTFYAVCDNSKTLIHFEVAFNSDCSIKSATVAGAITLSDAHDYEGAALLTRDIILLSEEDTPSIHGFNIPGGQERLNVPIPAIFSHNNIMRNQGFESLTLSPDKKFLFTANERALISDGNTRSIVEPFSSTTKVRIQRYTLDPTHTGQAQGFSPGSQFLYQTSGVHAFVGQIGLCDLVALDDSRLITLERSAGESLDRKRSIRSRIFLVDTTSAEDVSKIPSLKDNPAKPLNKTLLYDGNIFDDNGENLEGLCLGPEISPHRHILLGCIDNTDGIHVSESRLVAFELLLPAKDEMQPPTP